MPAVRRIDREDGLAAVRAWREGGPSRDDLARAVRFTLEELAHRHPGHAVEVRVAPFGAVQCVEGPRHTRGMPPSVVSCDAETWLGLATGSLGWSEAVSSGRLRSS